jgi:hypothetical protein
MQWGSFRFIIRIAPSIDLVVCWGEQPEKRKSVFQRRKGERKPNTMSQLGTTFPHFSRLKFLMLVNGLHLGNHEYQNGVQVVAGSNPVAPTTFLLLAVVRETALSLDRSKSFPRPPLPVCSKQPAQSCSQLQAAR